MMQTIILWEALAWKSLEHCRFSKTAAGAQAQGNIIGSANEFIFRISYHIVVNHEWKTIAASIKGTIGNRELSFELKSDGEGRWQVNGKPAPELGDCLDIDISLTPFTNTLAINRLRLRQGEWQEIKVVYFDLLAGTVSPLTQAYTRLADLQYRYENVPNDFEAVINIDAQHIVVDYPGLFRRLDPLP